MDYIELGKKIYNMENPREVKRCVVFVARCLLNNGRMKKIHQFFHQNELLAKIAEEYPFVYEQPTRAFFYRNSTFDERVELLEQLHEVSGVRIPERLAALRGKDRRFDLTAEREAMDSVVLDFLR